MPPARSLADTCPGQVAPSRRERSMRGSPVEPAVAGFTYPSVA